METINDAVNKTGKRYAVLNGRASRLEWWTFAVLNSLMIFLIPAFICSKLHLGETGVLVCWFLWFAFTITPTFTLNVRRLHDTGRSGWWLLIAAIPWLGWLVLFVLLGFLPGNAGDNEYGSNPKFETCE